MARASTGKSDPTRPQRLAIANLLRAAGSALQNAGVILDRGETRGAVLLARHALNCLLAALAAAEHGWPLDEWNAGLQAIPEANPFQPVLADLVRGLQDGSPVLPRADGTLAEPPDAKALGEVLRRAGTVLTELSEAFATDLAGIGPAGHVAPLRPDPVLDEAPSHPVKSQRRKYHADTSESPGSKRPSADSNAPAPGRNATGLPAPGSMQPARPSRPARVRNSRPQAPPAADSMDPQEVPGDAPTAAAAAQTPDLPSVAGFSQPAHTPEVTSAFFWSLMDRWRVGDQEALDLIGHQGGLTKKGTRPRFRVVGEEARRFQHLQEIDAALRLLDRDPARWIRQPLREAPFDGAAPLAILIGGGMREVRQKLLQWELQRSR